MGLAHAENLTVQAEAYDVALDMSFPKGMYCINCFFVFFHCMLQFFIEESFFPFFGLGADGGLDFGVIRVGEETKQTCTLKNKGKYEIGFHFFFESVDDSPSKIHDFFTINPSKGTLIQNDRPTQVQVFFKSKEEVNIKDLPILKCQVRSFPCKDSQRARE